MPFREQNFRREIKGNESERDTHCDGFIYFFKTRSRKNYLPDKLLNYEKSLFLVSESLAGNDSKGANAITLGQITGVKSGHS